MNTKKCVRYFLNKQAAERFAAKCIKLGGTNPEIVKSKFGLWIFSIEISSEIFRSLI